MAGVAGQFDDCEDSPREVDLLTEEHVEDLLEAVECLRGKVEQLQIHCEKVIYEKGQIEDRLILHENDSLEKMSHYENEVSELRKLNLQLLAGVKSDHEVPSWVKTSLDAEVAVKQKIEADKQVKSLQILLNKKDKQISNLEWQVMDAESTVTLIQAERDRLAVELDCLLAREEEKLEYYRDSSIEQVVFSDDEFDRETLTNQATRHLSDLTERSHSKIDNLTGLVHKGKHVSTLSDNDMPSSAAAEFQSGLKRTTNFSNINDIDEFTDFHQDEGVGGDGCPLDLSASFPSSKLKSLTSSCWHSFGSDSDVGVSPSSNIKNSTSTTAWVLSDVPCDGTTQDQDTHVEGCFEDAVDWSVDVEPASLGALAGSKNESCRSSSSAYFSDNSVASHDPWVFTPDSIIDVSTGEELKTTPPGSKDSLNDKDTFKSPEPTTLVAEEDTAQKQKKELSTKHNSDSTAPCDNKEDQNENIPCIKAGLNEEIKNGLNDNSGNHIKAILDVSFERTASVRSDSAMESEHKETVHHQKFNSEPHSAPRRHSDDRDGIVKLQAYQRWRMSGKKGQPPAKLKISQC